MFYFVDLVELGIKRMVLPIPFGQIGVKGFYQPIKAPSSESDLIKLTIWSGFSQK